MTEDEFRAMWLGNSRMTLWELRHAGLMVIPCDCGEDTCQGWGMAHVDTLDGGELSVLPEPYQTRVRELRLRKGRLILADKKAVSYTHLTLPTILLV